MNVEVLGLALVVLALCFSPVLIERLYGHRFRLSPALVVGTMHALVYPVGALGAEWREDVVDSERLRFDSDTMLTTIALALVALNVAYLVVLHGTPIEAKPMSTPEARRKLGTVFFFVLPAGFAYKVFLIWIGYYWHGEAYADQTTLHGMIGPLRTLGLVALGVSAYLGSTPGSDRRTWNRIALATLALEFLYWVPSGQRGYLFVAMLIHMSGRLFAGTWTLRRVGVVSVVALFTVAPAMHLIRTSEATRVRTESAAVAYSVTAKMLMTASDGQRARTMGDTVLQRMGEGLLLGRIVSWTPGTVPYAGASGLDPILYLYVPRVLWHDRPQLIDGFRVAAVYGVGSERAKSPIMLSGDLYRRFGYPGLLTGYAIFGAILGLLARRLRWPGPTPFCLVATFAVMPELFGLTSASILEMAPMVIRDQPLIWLTLWGILHLAEPAYPGRGVRS